jgi:hypothetical protein
VTTAPRRVQSGLAHEDQPRRYDDKLRCIDARLATKGCNKFTFLITWLHENDRFLPNAFWTLSGGGIPSDEIRLAESRKRDYFTQ